MSDFYGALLASSFRVKDKEAFLADPEVKKIREYALAGDGFFEADEDHPEYFAFGWNGQYPSTVLQFSGEEDTWLVTWRILVDTMVLSQDERKVFAVNGEAAAQQVRAWVLANDGHADPRLDFRIETEVEQAEELELDIVAVIERHILPGDVCQIGVSGQEKLRYIGGGLWFVTSQGTAFLDATTEWDTPLDLKRLRDVVQDLSTQVAEITA